MCTKVIDNHVLDVVPVLVGNPVRSAIELEKVVLAGDMARGELGRLPPEGNVARAPDVQRGDAHRLDVRSGVAPERAIPVQGAGWTRPAQRGDITTCSRMGQTRDRQRRLGECATAGVEEHLRRFRKLEQRDVRHARALRCAVQGRAERSGVRCRDRRQGRNPVRMLAGNRPRDSAAPIMPYQMKPLRPERAGDVEHVVAERADAVFVDAFGARSEAVAALVGRHGTVPGGAERGKRAAPDRRRLREAVQEQDQLAGLGTGGERVEIEATGIDARSLYCHGLAG